MTPGERYADESVLVTGAQGFVGSWLAERLLDEGARVVAPRRDLDPESRFRSEGVEERCEVVEADIRDFDALVRTLNEHRVGAVFHLASQAIVGIANRSPLSTYESNICGTYTLLEACRAVGAGGGSIGRIVVASTDHAYGNHELLPYREDYPLNAVYPYDVSKACTDMIARCYAATYEMPVAVTRMANIFGGGDRNWSRIVPDSARALVHDEAPVIRSDGSPERDFLYVDDAVEAYLTVAASLDRPELWGRAWNAGLGTPVSVLNLVRRLISASGKPIEPEIRGKGKPHAEIDRQYLDSAAIGSELGWSPGWTLDEGLEAAYAWYEGAAPE